MIKSWLVRDVNTVNNISIWALFKHKKHKIKMRELLNSSRICFQSRINALLGLWQIIKRNWTYHYELIFLSSSFNNSQKENHCTEREEKIKINQKKSLLLQKNNLSFHPKIIIIFLLKPQFSFKLTWLYQNVVKERKFTQPMPKEKQLLTNIYTYSYIPKNTMNKSLKENAFFLLLSCTFAHFPTNQTDKKEWKDGDFWREKVK